MCAFLHAHTGFLRFMSGAAPANCMVVSMAVEPSNPQALVVLEPMTERTTTMLLTTRLLRLGCFSDVFVIARAHSYFSVFPVYRSSWSPRPDRGSAGRDTGDRLSSSRPFTAVRPEDLTLPRPFTAAGSAVDLSQSRPFTAAGPIDASQTFESPRSSVVGR